MKTISICGMILATILLTAWSDAFAGYNSTLNKWTKSERVYNFNTLDVDVVWKATMLSDEMVKAQLKEKERRLKETPQEESADGVIRFFIGFYTREDLKNFSLNKDTTWKMFLVGADGNETPASKVEMVTITPTESVLYPYLNRWAKAYLVEFPKVDIGQRPELVLRSIVTESRLKWKIK